MYMLGGESLIFFEGLGKNISHILNLRLQKKEEKKKYLCSCFILSMLILLCSSHRQNLKFLFLNVIIIKYVSVSILDITYYSYLCPIYLIRLENAMPMSFIVPFRYSAQLIIQ